jgi:hypothetical protein
MLRRQSGTLLAISRRESFNYQASQGMTTKWLLMSKPNTVIYLHQLDPQAALERLNRVTGLRFSRWPQSLLPLVEPSLSGSVAATEPLSYAAQEGGVRP